MLITTNMLFFIIPVAKDVDKPNPKMFRHHDAIRFQQTGMKQLTGLNENIFY